MAERINKENFAESINQKKLVLVDFYSDSCIPCKKMSPILGDLEDNHENELSVYKVNINFDMEIAEKYGVLSTPTLVLFKDGEEADRKAGFQTLEVLENWLELYK